MGGKGGDYTPYPLILSQVLKLVGNPDIIPIMCRVRLISVSPIVVILLLIIVPPLILVTLGSFEVVLVTRLIYSLGAGLVVIRLGWNSTRQYANYAVSVMCDSQPPTHVYSVPGFSIITYRFRVSKSFFSEGSIAV